PRPVHELDVCRQQIVDPVLVDRMRVAAAHLHQLVVAAGLDQRKDLHGDGAAEVGVAELVDELHTVASRRGSAVPACTSSTSPGATGSTSAVSTVTLEPSSSAQSARPRTSSMRTTCIGTPSSPHVTQCWATTSSSLRVRLASNSRSPTRHERV